jgi:hypothetical protein
MTEEFFSADDDKDRRARWQAQYMHMLSSRAEELKNSVLPEQLERLRAWTEPMPVSSELAEMAERIEAIGKVFDRERDTQDAPAKRSRRIGWRDLALPYMGKVWNSEPFGTVKAFYRALERKAGESDSPFIRRNNQLFLKVNGKPVTLKTVQNNIEEVKRTAVNLQTL